MTVQSPPREEPLAAALDRVYRALADHSRAAAPTHDGPEQQPVENERDWQPFERLQALFGLSAFERDVVALCSGYALEQRFTASSPGPTFALALTVLRDPHWSAVTPAGPLRYWQLVELGPGSLLDAPLWLDERVLEFILGVSALDERLQPLVRELPGLPGGTPSRREAVATAARHWRRVPLPQDPLLLVGRHHSLCHSVFVQICQEVGLRPYHLDATSIPLDPVERERLARIWTREATLAGAALCIGTDHCDSIRPLASWLERVDVPVAVQTRPGGPAEGLDGLRLHLAAISSPERAALWRQRLGPLAERMNGQLERIVEYFDFDEPAIELAAMQLRESPAANPGEVCWRVCREHGRRSLQLLAQRIDGAAGWDDLVLPAAQLEMLEQIAIHVRRRAVVNEQWGFAAKHARGLGLTALFAGRSGTGKTMAAEILASELDLDLYKVDLASVVSKYIGETEKNLRAIFEAAQQSGAVLLFDEADALFGKRSEVRDSHDRYANLEISYLLQQMEAYHGVAILTTNMQHALDPAFVRRIRFIVEFPFPDRDARAGIWRAVFPAQTPLGELDFDALAQLNVSGGTIRNIATSAAFLAADDAGIVERRHILAAARSEYAKLGQQLTPVETRELR